jgi:uncharacterized protein
MLSQEDDIELDIPETLRPRALRALGIKPEWDAKVDALVVSKDFKASTLAIRLLRAYRAIRPRWIGDRCAFEPSCSRYSELSFRNFGFIGGLKLTQDRLCRCHSKNGGLDLPPNLTNDNL